MWPTAIGWTCRTATRLCLVGERKKERKIGGESERDGYRENVVSINYWALICVCVAHAMRRALIIGQDWYSLSGIRYDIIRTPLFAYCFMFILSAVAGARESKSESLISFAALYRQTTRPTFSPLRPVLSHKPPSSHPPDKQQRRSQHFANGLCAVNRVCESIISHFAAAAAFQRPLIPVPVIDAALCPSFKREKPIDHSLYEGERRPHDKLLNK